MNRVLYLGLMFCCAALLGCASLLPAQDPALNLKRASEDFNSLDKPAKAEELIWESIEIYKKYRNTIGLAEAYRQYALFLRSYAVEKFSDYFKEEGFIDKTVTFDTRYEKAVDYFNRSRELYGEQGNIMILSNLSVSLAKTYSLMGKQKEACDAFNEGLQQYDRYKKANPEAEELRSEELANYQEYIGIMKKQAGCADGAQAGDAAAGQ